MSEQQQGSSGQDGSKAGFGFSIKGKARAKVAVNAAEKQDDRQLITAVAEDGTIQTAGPAEGSSRPEYVVPALKNTYKTGVGKFVPTFVPEASTAAVTGNAEDRFERAEVGHAPTISSFGLEVRRRKDSATAAAADGSGDAGTTANGAAAAVAGSGGGGGQDRPLVPVQSRGDDAAQLKQDLEELPEAATVEDYESLPVEEFGKALLRGLGWSEGQGVGRKRQLVEPKQILRRPERLGLGANPAAPPPEKRPRKMGEKPREDLVAAPSADGRVRHRVGLDEALVPRASLAPGPQPGKIMEVVAGKHDGLLAAVREILEGTGPTARVLVELKPSGEVVEVLARDLAERGTTAAAAAGGDEGRQPPSSSEQQRSRHQAAGSSADRRDRDRDRQRDRERNRDRQRERDRGTDRDRERDRRDSSRPDAYEAPARQRDRSRDRDGGRSSGSRKPQQQQQQVLPRHKLWVSSLIRVRVVDKRVGGGRLYLKKGTVMDVQPDGGCDVRLEEEGRGVVTLHQDQLETVVPKEAGGGVMIVSGEHKGRKGRLLQASSSSGAAAVQLLGDMEVVRLLLDDVAQFMGHLDDEDE